MTGRSIAPVSRSRGIPYFSRLIVFGLVLASFLIPNLRICAQNGKPTQIDVQAVYLFDFARFVRWSNVDPGPTIDLCVAGQAIYIDTLKKVVSGESIEGRGITVRAAQRPEDLAACDVLFISLAAKDKADLLLAATKGKPILTVSDMPGFMDHGGMIQFLAIDKRIRFSINLNNVQQSGLSLSSELLKVAVSVDGKSSHGGAR